MGVSAGGAGTWTVCSSPSGLTMSIMRFESKVGDWTPSDSSFCSSFGGISSVVSFSSFSTAIEVTRLLTASDFTLAFYVLKNCFKLVYLFSFKNSLLSSRQPLFLRHNFCLKILVYNQHDLQW